MKSDRVALGFIAAILAVPLISGGAIAWALWRYRQAHPQVTVEPPPEESTAPSLVTTSGSTAPPPSLSASARATELVPAPPAVSIAAAPPPIEEGVDVVFDAKITRLEPSGVAPGGFAPGTRCTVETRLAAVDRAGLHLTKGVTARCGARILQQSNEAPPGARVKVTEQPGLDAGTFTYSLVLADSSVSIDTPHGRASFDAAGDPERAVSLVVAGESRPQKSRLLAGTPEARAPEASGVGDADDEARGRVVSATGDLPLDPGARCRLGFHHYGTIDGVDKCDVLIVCGGVSVIGRPERFSANCKRRGSHVLSAQEPKPGSLDKDPALELDEQRARIWNDLDGQRWSVSLTLDPRR